MLRLEDVVAELERAAADLGRDAKLDGDLLDLATLALAIRRPELWRNRHEA